MPRLEVKGTRTGISYERWFAPSGKGEVLSPAECARGCRVGVPRAKLTTSNEKRMEERVKLRPPAPNGSLAEAHAPNDGSAASVSSEEMAPEVNVIRFADGEPLSCRDAVAAEEPLEIQIAGVPLAVVMRTPGHDEDLTRGFLVTERVIADSAQLVSVRHCTRAAASEARDNVVLAELQDDVEVDLERLRRNLFASSSCGVCGKATLDNAMESAPPLRDASRFPVEWFYGLSERLRAGQSVFERTGGLHAAGLFAPDGSLLVLREDVGRHNAVDKVIGWALRSDRLPLAGHVLMVSGRISFEIVQKALAARIPVLAAVSAPSSLAVAFAERAGLTLVGFLRGRGLNVYAASERILGQAASESQSCEGAER